MLSDILLLDKIFGIKIIDEEDFIELICRFAFNMLIIVWIVRYIYYPITKRKDYLFTYLLFSAVVFFLCHLLANVKLSMGFALGLFAVFGIIRYRTDPIEIKEMTYLFIVIGIALINALANKKVSYTELIFTNFMLLFLTYGLEKLWLLKHEVRKNIIYENIELIKPDRHKEMMEDLRQRTGLDIHRFEIRRVDFLRDVANVRVYFFEKEGSASTYNELENNKRS